MFSPAIRWGKLETAALIVASLGLALFIAGSVVVIRPTTVRAATTTILIGGSVYGSPWFCDSAHSGVVCTTTITVGDTVTWQNTTIIYHTSTECDGNCGVPNPPGPLWDSGLIAPSGTFSRQFNQVGTFNYQCNIHPTQMKGQIIVLAAGPTATFTITPTPTATSNPTATPPPVGGISHNPGVGAARTSPASSWLALGIVVGAASTAFGLLSVLWVTRQRLLGQ